MTPPIGQLNIHLWVLRNSLVESIVSMITMELEHMLTLAMVCILSSQIFYPTTLERPTIPMS